MIFLVAVISVGLSAGLTYYVRRIALRTQTVDAPGNAPDRKIQRSPVPLLGGVAVYLTVTLVAWGVALFTHELFGGFFRPKYLVGMTVAGFILIVGGVLDDRKHLRPGQQIFFPILAALAVIASGIGIPYVTNPLGGTVYLNQVSWTLFTVHGMPYHLVLFADLFALVWLLATTYTTKILDGLDGLVAGITTIGGITIAALSLTKDVTQPEIAILAAILSGAAAGFLVWNWHPAKIFLGEGGSTYTGFMLGTLAIVAGGKIATALLILGIPAIDVAWAIIRRLTGHRRATAADRGHLHFRLLDVGLTHRQVVLLLYTVTAVFGSFTLVTHGEQKLYALLTLAAVAVLLVFAVVLAYQRQRDTQSHGQ